MLSSASIEILSPTTTIIVLGGVGITFIALATFVSRGRPQNRPEFLVANREMPVLATALSIAASWIGAPALFLAAHTAYKDGISGLLWYAIPNFLCLAVFGPFGYRLRQRLPLGYTWPQYVRLQHGRGLHFLYILQFSIVQICCFTNLLYKGSKNFEYLTGINAIYIGIILAALPLSYALIGGMRASVATDFLQMGIVYAVLFTVISWAIHAAGGFGTIIENLHGLAPATSTAETKPETLLELALSFGIPVTVTLLAGPLGDQMLWQRSFVVGSPEKVRRTFLIAGFAFIVVPLSLSLLGFLAASPRLGIGANIPEPDLIGPLVVSRLLPPAASLLLAIMYSAAIYSTLDSILCAVAALTSTDLREFLSSRLNPKTPSEELFLARLGMICVAVFGIMVVTIVPHLEVKSVFIFYGSCRAATMIPTILTLYWTKSSRAETIGEVQEAKSTSLDSRVAFWSVLLSLLIGPPLVLLGIYCGNGIMKTVGSLTGVVIGALFCGGWGLLSLLRKKASLRL
jgi:Na+/proline symporter